MLNTDILRDASIDVSLKEVVVSETENDVEFPRLGDLRCDADDPSRFPITITGPSSTISLEVSKSYTVGEIKEMVAWSPDGGELPRLELAGKKLDDEQTVLESGIPPGAKLSLVLQGSDGDMAQHGEDVNNEGLEVERDPVNRIWEQSLGVEQVPINRAKARILYHWDGLMPNGQRSGLPLQPGDAVMISRIINQDWYEGYSPDNEDEDGWIPREFVEIESLYDESFREELGSDAEDLPVSVLPRRRRRRHRRDRFYAFPKQVLNLLTGGNSSQRKSAAATSVRRKGQDPTPPIPPSPFPEKPAVSPFDLFDHGNRVRLNFRLVHDEPPTIIAILSLVSAPQTRISYATVELEFEHDTIIELEPKRKEAPETEVHHTNTVANVLSVTGGVNQGPAGVGLEGSHTATTTSEYSRRTKGTVVGDGEGSSTAYWVFKEDPGEAGRSGLDPEQRMAVKLHIRPFRIDYVVNVKVVADDGRKGGLFSTKRLSSGRLRYHLRV